MLTRTSSGAAVTAKWFFRVKRRGERVRSARRPEAKVAVARERPGVVSGERRWVGSCEMEVWLGSGARGEEMCAPMIVRYCICQPYESLLSGVSVALF